MPIWHSLGVPRRIDSIPIDRLLRESVGSNIQKARLALGLTQPQLAEALQARANTVSRWESGERLPDLEVIYAIGAALHIDPRHLLPAPIAREKNRHDIP